MTKRTAVHEQPNKATADFTAQVRSVLDEAHAAAAAARDEYLRAAKLDPHGHPIDSMGSGDLIVFKPSRRLREALKALGEITKDTDGRWWIANFRVYGVQSLTAAERTCEAARAVLMRAFPADGDFRAQIRMD
jgi:hypothetical protein